MAERDSFPVTKDEKQLKKEKKEQEKLQKEKEKREKKLEKERKKLEEKERKQREKETKAQQKLQQAEQLPASEGDQVEASRSTEKILPPTEEPNSEPAAEESEPAAEESEPAAESTAETHKEEPQDAPNTPPQPSSEAEDKPPADVATGQLASSWPEKVTVAEAPGQISGCGKPIGIVFNTSLAGQGPLTASCRGAKGGDVAVLVTQPGKGKGLVSVRFTPKVADVYVLNVRWGEKPINGSPFSINLSRLPPATEETSPSPPPQKTEVQLAREEEQRKIDAEDSDEEEEEAGELSDDPFEMAFQASRLLEQQRQKAAVTATSQPIPAPAPVPHGPTPRPNPQTSPALAATVPPIPQAVSTHHHQHQHQALPYPTSPTPALMPQPYTADPHHVGTTHLREANKSLQEANQGLGEEVADLKKKMGEFEAKLTHIEESSRAAEEERRELMANTGMHGWLYKRGIKGPTANVWRRRYFRCDQGSKIYYYKASEETVPRGTIDLEGVLSVDKVVDDSESASAESSSERFGFYITCGERTYQLQAEEEHMRKEWMATFEYLKNWYMKNKSPRLAPKVA